MRRKIIGILVCMLLITTAVSAVGTMKTVEDKKIFTTQLTGVEWSRIYNHESELFDDCNIQDVETLSQFYNCVTYDDLDTFIIHAMDEYHIPGLSASIVRNGSFLLTRSYGYAKMVQTQSVPVEDTTLFLIASISKTITATATMQLYEQGFFDLDDPINDYLPFQVIHPDFPSTDITFHMLLTHSSGIKDNWNVMPLYIGDSPNPLGTWLEDYLTPGGQYYDPDKNFQYREPGTSWGYCNVAVALVGYLVEVISDAPFDEYCGTNIFEPLDMDETAWFLADLDINHIAVPYSWNGNEYVPYPHQGWDCYPAGFLRTSITQLRNFLLMYMNYGEYNSTIILDNDTVELMLTLQLPFSQTQGIIWRKHSLSGRTTWGHSGSLPGCRTIMLFDPETNIGVIVLTNGDPSFSGIKKIADALFDFAETPNAPTIHGPPNGNAGTEYEYTFNAVDPDDDDVKYHIEWGDGDSDTTVFSPSATDVKVKHTWSKRGTYIIKAAAEDTDGLVGPTATLKVTMPRNRTTYNSLFLRFLEQFPILQTLLQR